MKKFAYTLICTALLTTSLVGCGGSNNNSSQQANQNTKVTAVDENEPQHPATTKAPDEVVDKFLKNIQHQKYAGNSATYKENMDNMADFRNQIETISPSVAGALFDKLADFTYKIDDTVYDDKDDTKATVLVTMNYYDLGSKVNTAFLSYIANNLEMTYTGSKEKDIIESAEKNIIPIIDSAQQVSVKSVPITLTREDTHWKINKMTDNPLLLNILTGNILNSIHQYIELQ